MNKIFLTGPDKITLAAIINKALIGNATIQIASDSPEDVEAINKFKTDLVRIR
jgi:hypothetical protein